MQEKAQDCVMSIIIGFQHISEMPAETFRTELMQLYLEVLIGMRAFGPDMLGQIDKCKDKLLALYKKKDILPMLTL